jgi:hypothetical protein
VYPCSAPKYKDLRVKEVNFIICIHLRDVHSKVSAQAVVRKRVIKPSNSVLELAKNSDRKMLKGPKGRIFFSPRLAEGK